MIDVDDTQPEILPMGTMDIAEEKRQLLKKCLAATFPEIVTEGDIDFDQLKRVLGEWVEPNRERFGLNWPGKAACMKVIQAPSVGTLKPCPEESINWETTENLFVEGDNLEVLKLLQKAYFGKVKLIYIDPPYNTGKEFIYPDKFGETLDTYLEYTGQKDSEGRKFATNTETSGRYHSRWLSMMYPRIYLARNLLSDGGVIFMSIDENEQSNLKALCDFIFGEHCFIADVVWRSKDNSNNDAKKFSLDHNHILVYGKRDEWEPEKLSDNKKRKHFKNPDDDTRGPYFDGNPLNSPNYRENLIYDLISPNGTAISSPKNGWRWSKDVMQAKIASGEIRFTEDQSGIRRRTYLKDMKGLPPSTLWIDLEQTGHNRQAKYELVKLMSGDYYDTPKPARLMAHIVHLAAADKSSVILDFFAGSCSMAQAVIERNAEDGGNRKFVMVQLPEPCPEGSDAEKAGFSTIADIGKERIRRVVQQLAESGAESNSTLGFRVFKLGKSCFHLWDGDVEHLDDQALLTRIQDHERHLDGDAAPEDVLFELLLKDGFPLTVPMERLKVAGKEVFSIAEGALMICLETELTEELMDGLAEMEPARVICLDGGFRGNDQLKANAVQTFKARARAKGTAIEFRTV